MNHRYARLLCHTLLLCTCGYARAGAAPAPLQYTPPPLPVLHPAPTVDVAPPMPPDQAHLDAVAALLDASHIPEVTAASMYASFNANADQRAFAQYMAAHVTKAELTAALAPVYARYVSADSAARLAPAFGTPLAQRVMRLAEARRSSPTTAPGNLANRADLADWNAFNRSAPAHAMGAIIEQAGKEAVQALALLMHSHGDAIAMQALRAIFAHGEAWIRTDQAQAPLLYRPAETGIPYIDRFVSLIATTAWTNSTLSWSYNKDLRALGLRSVALPENLVTPEGVAHGLAKLDAADARLDGFKHEAEADFNVFRGKLIALNMPGGEEMRKQIATSLEHSLQMTVGTVENQRTLLGVMRRLLTFAQQRQGHLALQNGSLVMSKEDQVIFNGLRDEALHEAKRSVELENQADLFIKKMADPVKAAPVIQP